MEMNLIHKPMVFLFSYLSESSKLISILCIYIYIGIVEHEVKIDTNYKLNAWNGL